MIAAAVQIRRAKVEDAQAIAAIYNHYVHNSTATFQEIPATAGSFYQLIKNADGDFVGDGFVDGERTDNCRPFFCAVSDGAVVGYCYADLFKSRCGYRYTLESSIYIDAQTPKRGIGTALMETLLDALKSGNARKLVAVIGLPNSESIAFHKKFGFVHCGTLPKVGEKFGKLLDSSYWVKDIK